MAAEDNIQNGPRLGDEALLLQLLLIVVLSVVVLPQGHLKVNQSVALGEGDRDAQLLVLLAAQADDGVREDVAGVRADELIQQVDVLLSKQTDRQSIFGMLSG